MDKRIRRNELCVIGLPRCDFVFSSTRSCFIAYGFEESALEMSVLRYLLSQRGIEPIEAGGMLAPAQNAFCAKICSKVITSQFCIVLLNSDVRNGIEVPNANVNMEYGLMLGFNKYVIPFQRTIQHLPFNVAGLDTVKYSNEDFEAKASKAIDAAISATTQDTVPPINPGQALEAFFLSRGVLVAPIDNQGEKDLFALGRQLGFNMLMTFDGMRYMYFGNFTTLRPEAVVWRLKTLQRIVAERLGSIKQRVKLGMKIDSYQTAVLNSLSQSLQVWVSVTGDDEKRAVSAAIVGGKFEWPVEVFSMSEVASAVRSMS